MFFYNFSEYKCIFLLRTFSFFFLMKNRRYLSYDTGNIKLKV